MGRKIWLIADTHFGYRGDDDIWLNDYISYFEEIVIPVMKSRSAKDDILIHLGDVFDNRTSIGLNTLSRTISLFEKFSGIFSDIRIIVGNHDSAKKNTNDITSVDVLKHIDNVTIYYKPEVSVIDGKRCLFNPWVENLEEERNILLGVDADYVFGHLMIGGSQTSNRAGVKIDINSGVRKSDFKSAHVYAGHIHIRQDDKNIHYVGNPYHKDRGDRGNRKGITILDIETGETEFIENTVSPVFVNENVYDIMNVTVGDLKNRWRNNYVDLHMSGKDLHICDFDTLRECLGGCFRELRPVCDDDIITVSNEENEDFTENDVISVEEHQIRYVESIDIDEKKKDSLKKYIKELENRI